MLNEDMRMKYIHYNNKAQNLIKQVKVYQENYHDVDIGKMHEKTQQLVFLC